MGRRRYYRKQYFGLSTELALFLALGALGILLLSKAVTTSSLSVETLSTLLIVAIGALIIILAGVWFIFRKITLARLRALRISNVDHMTGVQFEQYIGGVLKTAGYKIRYTAASGDYGVDIVAEKDGTKYAIQLKRYHELVAQEAVREAVAGLARYGCIQAVVVTNSFFTQHAKDLALANKCVLVDRTKLTGWILAFQQSNKKPLVIDLQYTN